MPTIAEEPAQEPAGGDLDFADLLALPEAAFMTPGDAGPTGMAHDLQSWMPTQPMDSSDPLSHDLMGAWDLPNPGAGSTFGIAEEGDYDYGLEAPDYTKFENWIPQFIRPPKPCQYCRAKRFNCYITRGDTACTPCSSLFRDCSLTSTLTSQATHQPFGHSIDNLRAVDEDTVMMKEATTSRTLQTPPVLSDIDTADDTAGSNKRRGIRFPRQAVKVLRDWMDSHAGSPYPSEDEKAELESRTGLKPTQISNWLANARRRRKAGRHARPKLCASPSLKPITPPINIPRGSMSSPELDPLERWKNSPPEHEPASITDIANAVANSALDGDTLNTSPSSLGWQRARSSNGSGLSDVLAPSTTSFETGHSAPMSADGSRHSGQSHGSFGSFSSSLTGKKDRRRRRRQLPAPPRKLSDDKKRMFQCTFCTDTFKSKYDWTRHEKTLHLSLEKWMCAPLGPVITDRATGKKKCVYCDELDPTDEHVETHNHRQCEEKGPGARTFYRKDHLRQHVRLVHNCKMTPSMDTWKSVTNNINCRCGFCGQRFASWQERVDHLATHFKSGARMSEWKGCRGLDPNIAALVTDAMPPFLIGHEALAPDPFSATNKATLTQDVPNDATVSPDNSESVPQDSPGSSKANCWEILTIGLGEYANKMAKQGVVLTDDMLQAQARRIIYDDDDAWNQTAADNPEWLDLFKKAHGLDYIPSRIGGLGQQIPEDLETYSDLGLRIPFSVQLQAYNQQQLSNGSKPCDPAICIHTDRSRKEKCADNACKIPHTLREGVIRGPNDECGHLECKNNQLRLGADTTYRWCTYDLPPAVQEASGLQKTGGEMWADNAPKSGTLLTTAEKETYSYLPRYKYELPAEKARRFASVTGAWTASGVMPPSFSTAQQQQQENATMTTDTMMDFLDDNIPLNTSPNNPPTVPTPPLTAAQEAAMLADIDKFIAESQGQQTTPSSGGAMNGGTFEYEDASWMTMPPSTATEIDLPPDFDMKDLGAMEFDDMFDMDHDAYKDLVLG